MADEDKVCACLFHILVVDHEKDYFWKLNKIRVEYTYYILLEAFWNIYKIFFWDFF